MVYWISAICFKTVHQPLVITLRSYNFLRLPVVLPRWECSPSILVSSWSIPSYTISGITMYILLGVFATNIGLFMVSSFMYRKAIRRPLGLSAVG